MTYDALINGASGILYWGVHYNAADADYWQVLKGIARELRDLSPALTAKAAPASSGNPAVEVLARAWQGDLFILAANTTAAMHTGVRLRFEGTGGVPAAVLFEARTLSLEGSAVTDDFGPHEVHVYRIVGAAEE